MDDISRSVAESIKSGEYFKDARNWYAHRYLFPLIERSLLIITGTVALIVLTISYLTIYEILPVTKEVPFIIKVQDGLNYYSSIHSLKKYSEDPQKAIAEYLVADYVKTRESYLFKNVDKQMTRIKGASSKQQFKKFEAYMSIQNPESPLLTFQKTTTRTIDILKVALNEEDVTQDRATVRFRATVDNHTKKEKSITTWEAKLVFSLPDINTVYKEKTPVLDFIVTDYKATELK